LYTVWPSDPASEWNIQWRLNSFPVRDPAYSCGNVYTFQWDVLPHSSGRKSLFEMKRNQNLCCTKWHWARIDCQNFGCPLTAILPVLRTHSSITCDI
jgi:hypothetical protein